MEWTRKNPQTRQNDYDHFGWSVTTGLDGSIYISVITSYEYEEEEDPAGSFNVYTSFFISKLNSDGIL